MNTFAAVAFHTILTILTGGLWLIVLLIWFIVKKR